MKRRIFKLALFLLLGAIINIAVAWRCAAVMDPNGVKMRSLIVSGDEQDGITVVQSRFGHVRTNSMLESAFNEHRFRSESRCGWPTLTLRCHTYDGVRLGIGESWTFEPMNDKKSVTVNGGIELSPWNSYPCDSSLVAFVQFKHARSTPPGTWRALPCIPVWPGFAINTVFYAAILWLPFAMIGVVRRRVRVHRGRCTACGYDLRGFRGRASENNLCPECGVGASKPS